MTIKKSLMDILNDNEKFLIVSHEAPDGDAIGSVLALGKVLENLNKEYRAYIGDEIPKRYKFLYGADKIITTEDEIDILPEITFALDCADLNRANIKKEANINFIINIDHHISNTSFGDINIIDSKSSATGEVLYNLFKDLSIKIDMATAEALYTAILTDTGSFRFTNTTSYSHIVVSNLIKKGIDTQKIIREIYEKRSIANLKVLGETLDNLEISNNGKYAWSFITREMMEKAKAKESDTEGIINYIREIDGVEIGILFKETLDSTVKVGFRSNEHIDVSLLASYFSGGGHKKAAGCEINDDLDVAIKKVIRKIEDTFEIQGD